MTDNLQFMIKNTHQCFRVNADDIYLNNGSLKIGIRVNKEDFLNIHRDIINNEVATLTCIDKDNTSGVIPLTYNGYNTIKVSRETIDKYYKCENGHIITDNRNSLDDNVIIEYVNITNLKYYSSNIYALRLYIHKINSERIICKLYFKYTNKLIVAKHWENNEKRTQIIKQIRELEKELKELP